MLEKAGWISGGRTDGCSEFCKTIEIEKPIRHAILKMTALGVYAAYLDGLRVGRFRMAPGWTVYAHRVQVQTYDVTEMLRGRTESNLSVTVANGWYLSDMSHWLHPKNRNPALIAEIRMIYTDGTERVIGTDETWLVRESKTRYKAAVSV